MVSYDSPLVLYVIITYFVLPGVFMDNSVDNAIVVLILKEWR